MIANAMNIMRVGGYYQDVVLGVFVVFFVFVYGRLMGPGSN